MTKAQEKRNKQFRESLTNRLTTMFNPFRNHNYISYVNSKIAPFQKILDSKWNQYSDKNEAYEDNKGKTYIEVGISNKINPRNYTTKEARDIAQTEANNTVVHSGSFYPIMRQVTQARKVMSLLEIHRLEWLGEVKVAFDGRFDSMINSMCSGMGPKKSNFEITVEELSNSWEEFEVLIHVEETTFHARAIWVNCVDKISHYRFITTTRKRK